MRRSFLHMILAAASATSVTANPAVPDNLPDNLIDDSLLPHIEVRDIEPRQQQQPPDDCPNYTNYARTRHEPYSSGAYALAYQRPEPRCRTFNSSAVEDLIEKTKASLFDPDLSRLFENSFPNTLDTAVRWHGMAANNSNEELSFIITGDINALWIRDSASQIAPYLPTLKDKNSDIAPIWRGLINLQARYLVINPYCNAFNPPPESGIKFEPNGAFYIVTPNYDRNFVFTCNFELDDFGSFLQLSHDYYQKTGDIDFFSDFQWVYAVQSILRTITELQRPSYSSDGVWMKPLYTFQSQTTTSTGTLGNHGTGSPVNYTGMARSPFRASDDAAIYDFQIPANMMVARYLRDCAAIMAKIPAGGKAPAGLAEQMTETADEIMHGINTFGIVTSPTGERIYAYEVDGFGGVNLMDDANVPSLLSAPFLGYLDASDPVYGATRKFVLSRRNPWWCQGNVISAIGSGHVRPGAAWPMSSIMRALTSSDDAEIMQQIKQVLSSTDGLGLVHESVLSTSDSVWTRQWFGWANGLFGQLILDIANRKPHLLKESYQPGFYSDKLKGLSSS